MRLIPFTIHYSPFLFLPLLLASCDGHDLNKSEVSPMIIWAAQLAEGSGSPDSNHPSNPRYHRADFPATTPIPQAAPTPEPSPVQHAPANFAHARNAPPPATPW